MDRSERLVRKHLEFLGFTSVVYEPDGKVPPDFLVDGRIAVEVRRLNENERGLAVPKGLEEVATPLLLRLTVLLKSYGPPRDASWLVNLHYERPTPRPRVVDRRARAFLDAVVRDPVGAPRRATIGNVELEVVKRSTLGSDTFALFFDSDADSGGWVFEELERNLRLCVPEKSAKVAAF